MPKRGLMYKASDGTIFAWHPDYPEDPIEAILPAAAVTLNTLDPGIDVTCSCRIPAKALDEFLAHVLTITVDEACKVLLFPSLRAPTPKGAA